MAPSTCPIVKRRVGRYALETTLRTGFVIEEGMPDAKLFDRHVQDDYAKKRNANQRDLQ